MTRRIWIIVTAVILAVATIGGVAAFAGGGDDDDQEANPSPSIGMPAPDSEGINETIVHGGPDVEVLPEYDGPADGPPRTEGPIEEPGDEFSRDAGEGAGSLEGGPVTNGELAGDEGDVIDGGSTSSGMVVPGFEGVVTDFIVEPSS
ncbi:MAG: hypothetical protein OER12_05180 [Acidimicrobiia bacterium]|nr:hypothetical protein [Acidimicrobiia bacterium]